MYPNSTLSGRAPAATSKITRRKASSTRKEWCVGRSGRVVVVFLCLEVIPFGWSQPSVGDLKVTSGGDSGATIVNFSAKIAQPSAGFDKAQLSLPSGCCPPLANPTHVKVLYSDSLPTSTVFAQKEILVMVRDPAEYEATLESINSQSNDLWHDNTRLPFQSRFPSLPWALIIPYPLDTFVPGTESVTALLTQQFTGSPNTFLNALPCSPDCGNPLQLVFGSVKGLYEYQHGVCSTEVQQGPVLSTILAQGPLALATGINAAIPSPVEANPQIDAFNLASFVARTGPSNLTGGFVQQLAINVHYPSPNQLADAVVRRNYTYHYVLDTGLHEGILTATSSTNNGFDTGGFSGSIASGIDSSLPSGITSGIELQALIGGPFTQMQPIRSSSKALVCDPRIPLRPSHCFMQCANVPTQLPPGLSGTNLDDSAWYDKSFCLVPAIEEIRAGVAAGATAQGVNPADITQLQDNLTKVQPHDPTKSVNLRCNFHPNYEVDPKPTCEIAVRAKRINVYPDTVELVWFDAPSLTEVGRDAFGNEAFSVFLLSRAAGPSIPGDVGGSAATLCSRQPNHLSTSNRTFVNATLH